MTETVGLDERAVGDAPVSRVVQGEATRARLVAVAVETLETGGEQSVRVREIAAALGVSIGAVYHHFPSREDLIVAARVAQFEAAIRGDVEAVRDLVERATTVDELREGMRAITRSAHGAERAEFRRLRAEIGGVAQHNAELRDALARVQNEHTAALADAVELGQRKGLGSPSLDPRAVATFFQAIALGLVIDDINLLQPMDREAWFVLTDRLFDALLAPV